MHAEPKVRIHLAPPVSLQRLPTIQRSQEILADPILVNGNPETDIGALRNISTVVKNGVAIDRFPQLTMVVLDRKRSRMRLGRLAESRQPDYGRAGSADVPQGLSRDSLPDRWIGDRLRGDDHAHLLEVMLWAAGRLLCGEVRGLGLALYYSAGTIPRPRPSTRRKSDSGGACARLFADGPRQSAVAW